MPALIDIIGINPGDSASLRPDLVERIETAEFLAGGERHLGYFPNARGQRFIIKDNLADLVEQLSQRGEKQRCVVLASGDPLFYGIGSYLAGILGPMNLRIEPAPSSMQLAFARVGLSWQEAVLASIHGRKLRPVLLPLLGQKLIGLFTQDGNSPAEAARFFLERCPGYEAIVAENLGMDNERLTRWPNLEVLAKQSFAPLNYLILRRTRMPVPSAEVERNRSLVPGVPDDVFERPADRREVMTRQEVRSVVVGKLAGMVNAGDFLWDIGAGLGTVSVEMAVLRPALEVVAVERNPERAVFVKRNREGFAAFNIRVVEGTAPEALAGATERPRLVFIGGSGNSLGGILDLVGQRLQAGGRLAATFVTLEHLAMMLQRLKEWSWPPEVTEIQVSRSDDLAGLTGLKPQRSVFLVCADNPGGSMKKGRE